MTSGTVMAFDYGLRHIGVAVGNRMIASANPLAIVRARDGAADWPAIDALLQQWRPDCLVVGLPLNMDGSESDMSVRARKFCRQLKGRFSIVCFLQDERLTSREAKLARRDTNANQKGTVDAEAACLILQAFWRQPTGHQCQDGSTSVS